MEEEIIALFKAHGYKFKEMINELTGLLGAAILSYNQDTVEYSNDKFDMNIQVIPKDTKHGTEK
tara:strand:+ start:29 stop:220 length:192 start_codon:yes stop_codon:yes gene_type:complete